MSSFKKAFQSRRHQERSQPLGRQKRFGLLEKKADYKARAGDYHRKQDALNTLHAKAQQRNPDEFYFGMVSTATRNGVHVVPRSHEHGDLNVLKQQDKAYLTCMSSINSRKITQSHIQPLCNTKIVFDKDAQAPSVCLENVRLQTLDERVHKERLDHLNVLLKRKQRQEMLDAALLQVNIQQQLMVIFADLEKRAASQDWHRCQGQWCLQVEAMSLKVIIHEIFFNLANWQCTTSLNG